ncbi:MAG: hypothetical protein GDA48_12040 [Hormoscilla sp. GM102CHS1]|nr:hypothetical protein [Hormoscilla sp. GM102CHS1]
MTNSSFGGELTTETINLNVNGKGWEIYVTFPLEINEAIENATSSPDPDKQLEAMVARLVQQEGCTVIRFNALFYSINPRTGGQNPIGEIDIEVGEAIIEVTTRAKNKSGQVQKFLTDPWLNMTGKPVILYAPNITRGASNAVIKVGGIVATDQSQLSQEIQRLRSNSNA